MHKYNKNFNINKSLYPNIFSIINAIPDTYVFKHQGFRHPGGILNRATDEIIRSLELFINSFNNIQTDYSNGTKVDISRQKELLDYLRTSFDHFNSLYDESFMILKTLCAPPSVDLGVAEKFVSAWLQKNNFKCGDDFIGRTNNIQKFISFFFNRLKHANVSFDWFVAKINKPRYILGFFSPDIMVKEIKDNSVYPFIPDKYNNNQTIPFSFNFILKSLILSFYEICDDLEITIKEHLKKTHGFQFSKINKIKHNASFEKIISEIAKISDLFYPFEHKKFPKIQKISSDEFKISFPNKNNCPYKFAELSAQYISDGYTKEFPLPQFIYLD